MPTTDPPGLTFRQPTPADADAITRIDAEGRATGDATFRDTSLTWEDVEAAWLNGSGLCILAELDGTPVAYAGVTPMSGRCVYSGLGEVSIYLAANARGKGIAKATMNHLIQMSETAGYWTLVAEIISDNAPSIGLHQSCGFEVLGIRKHLGKMTYGPHAGQWRDVTMLERRSSSVGID